MRALLEAARLDERSFPHAALLCGRAMRPDGFAALQRPPLCLSAYAAARVRLAMAHAPGVSDADLAEAALAYVAVEPWAPPEPAARLGRLCARGGTDSTAAPLALLCARDLDAALSASLPRPPHPALRAALASEIATVRGGAIYARPARETQ